MTGDPAPRIVRRTVCLSLAVLGLLLGAAPATAQAGTCTGVSAARLQAPALAPTGSALSAPLSDWEQISAQCTPPVTFATLTVPDCQPGCGPVAHRGIVEWWAHAPGDCSATTTAVPNDTLVCPAKADGRICMYVKKSPGPDAPTAIASESLRVDFPTGPSFNATPALGPAAAGCGPGDHPSTSTSPQVYTG